MNPSYCRIRVPQAVALERFAAWQQLPQVGPLLPADSVQAVRLACDERGMWRGNAVLVSEVGAWTLFSDLSGVLGGVPAERWRAFAGSDELVFAGYNDANGYGEFVLVRGGRVVREFLDADLVDTLHVAVAPLRLGSGSRLWESPAELDDRFHRDEVPSPSGVVHHLLWRR